MAAPTPTTRVAPAGKYLPDGFKSLITPSRDTNIEFWEKTVQPPGIDGGDPIDTTTMHNSLWRTMRARQLKTLTQLQIKVAYDPVLYTSILNLVNQEDTYTIRFGDGSTIAFYAFLKSFEPGELAEGQFPEATITIVPTNWDPVNDVEAGPAVAEVAGT